MSGPRRCVMAGARVPVHQLFYLLGHWVLFGPAYANATLRACDEILAR